MGRDQLRSSFADKLERFCSAARVRSAVLVDADGESVDYAGRGDPFELRIGAAEARLLLQRLEQFRSPPFTEVFQLTLRAAERSWSVVTLASGYALVVELSPGSMALSSRALAQAARELAEDAGLTVPTPPSGSWIWVQVEADSARPFRPKRVLRPSGWTALSVVGRLADPTERGEYGYRVLLEVGAEVTLVREPGARWFAEPHTLFAPSGL